MLLMHNPARGRWFFYAWTKRQAFSHFFPPVSRIAHGAAYANYLLQTHPSLFSLPDGRAISFNSPTNFAGKSRRARRGSTRAHRGHATRLDKRIARISAVIHIFAPPCDCISSKFSVLSRCWRNRQRKKSSGSAIRTSKRAGGKIIIKRAAKIGSFIAE